MNKKPRGFALLSEERRRQISASGGKQAHVNGTAHQWNTKTARKAGAIGGAKIAANREYMAEIGRKGGEAKKRNDLAAAAQAGESVT